MYPMTTIVRKANHRHHYNEYQRHRQQIDHIIQLINQIADHSARWERTTSEENSESLSSFKGRKKFRNGCRKYLNSLICHGHTYPSLNLMKAGRKRVVLNMNTH